MLTLTGFVSLAVLARVIWALFDVHMAPGGGRWGMIRTSARAAGVVLMFAWVALAIWTVVSINPPPYPDYAGE